MSYSPLDEHYITSDMAEISLLLYYNFPIELIDKPPNEKRCYFHFKKDEKLKKILVDYLKHELTVEPLKYFNAIREAKTRLHSV
jgi:hypothetical protein